MAGGKSKKKDKTGGLKYAPPEEVAGQSYFANIKEVAPYWWPKHEDGTIVSHVYLRFDDRTAAAVMTPKLEGAISHALQTNPVDFGNKDVKKAVKKHVCRCFLETPFLSASYSIDARFSSEQNIDRSKIIARINLISMFYDGYFKKGSFVDLGNEIAFKKFFPKPDDGLIYIGEHKF